MHVQGGTTSLSSPLYRHCLKSEDIVITRSIFISLGTIGCSAGVPCQRPLPDGRRRDTMSSTFNLITVSGCALYVSVDVWRLSFPGYRLSSLEQSAMPRHCTVTACFLQSSEDRSLQTQFSLTILLCPRSDIRHYGHDNRCFYLLTYLLYIARSVLQLEEGKHWYFASKDNSVNWCISEGNTCTCSVCVVLLGNVAVWRRRSTDWSFCCVKSRFQFIDWRQHVLHCTPGALIITHSTLIKQHTSVFDYIHILIYTDCHCKTQIQE